MKYSTKFETIAATSLLLSLAGVWGIIKYKQKESFFPFYSSNANISAPAQENPVNIYDLNSSSKFLDSSQTPTRNQGPKQNSLEDKLTPLSPIKAKSPTYPLIQESNSIMGNSNSASVAPNDSKTKTYEPKVKPKLELKSEPKPEPKPVKVPESKNKPKPLNKPKRKARVRDF